MAMVAGWAIACLALAAAGPAVAQEERGGPDALWEAYPLKGDGFSEGGLPLDASEEPGELTPSRPVEEGGTDVTLAMVLAALAVMGLISAVAVASARRARPAPPPAAEPEPESEPEPPDALPPGTPVLGYVQLAGGEPDAEGLGVQESRIRRECTDRGWRLLGVACDDQRTLAAGDGRPGLESALERLGNRDASCLVVSRLDRLGRSALELDGVMREITDADATLVSLDFGIDTSSEPGSLVTDVLAGVAAWERDRLTADTRNGLASVRAARRRHARFAVPPAGDEERDVRERVAAMRADGLTLQAIADTLNAEGVPTLRGGALWRPSSVQAATGYKRPRHPDAREQEEQDA